MPKDTREIVRGVQIPEGSVLRTFAPGEEDALEAVLTPAQAERLKASGSIIGDWEPKASEPAMLKSNRRVQPEVKDLQPELDKALAELATVKAELKVARDRIAELESAAKPDSGKPDSGKPDSGKPDSSKPKSK